MSGIGARSFLVVGPRPARYLAQRVQLGIASGMRVLYGDVRPEFDVGAQCPTKPRIVRQAGRVRSSQVQLDEALTLLFGDSQARCTSIRCANPPMVRVNWSGPPNDSESKAVS